jgi:hypothetical protein
VRLQLYWHLALLIFAIHEAPVWIVPCLEGGTPTRTSGSSIYPAVQNMLLVARALGLGATLTTLYLPFEKEAEAALGLPSGVQRWRFLVIRDAKVTQTVGAYYKRAWDEQVGPRYRAGEPASGMDRDRFLWLLDAAEYLASHSIPMRFCR